MAGHGFVYGQQLQLVEVVLAQLGFDAGAGPVRRNRRDPVKCAQLRLQGGRRIEAAHRVDAAHELGRRNHLQVGARWQREQVLLRDELARFFQVLAWASSRYDSRVECRSAMRVQDLGNHQVFRAPDRPDPRGPCGPGK